MICVKKEKEEEGEFVDDDITTEHFIMVWLLLA
jgi:hypothetical protein